MSAAAAFGCGLALGVLLGAIGGYVLLCAMMAEIDHADLQARLRDEP